MFKKSGFLLPRVNYQSIFLVRNELFSIKMNFFPFIWSYFKKNNAFCPFEALSMVQNDDQQFGLRANCLVARVKTGNAGAKWG